MHNISTKPTEVRSPTLRIQNNEGEVLTMEGLVLCLSASTNTLEHKFSLQPTKQSKKKNKNKNKTEHLINILISEQLLIKCGTV